MRSSQPTAQDEPHTSARRALVLAGTGRYGDPWHPFVKTASIIATTLTAAGWRAELRTDLDAALGDVGDADLIVVDAGDPWRNGETWRGADPAATAGLADAVARGVGVIAVHNAVSTLRDYPQWHAVLGGEWVVGRTGHPPLAESLIEVVREHPVTSGLTAFVIEDEVYHDLRIGEVTVLAVHRADGVAHPLVWVNEHGSCRIVVSALGHDERSFASEEHQQLLRQAAAWAARRG